MRTATPHHPSGVVGDVLALVALLTLAGLAAVQPWLVVVSAAALGGGVGIYRLVRAAGVRRPRS